MELKNSHRLEATRNQVWAYLHDADMLQRCIPGCETLGRLSGNELEARVKLRIGPVNAAFKGTVKFENRIEPVSLTLTGAGNGGIAGHARGGADVILEEVGEATVLTYEAHAQVGGKIAQLGSRLVQSTARKLAAEFFSRFEKEIANLSEPSRTEATLAG